MGRNNRFQYYVEGESEKKLIEEFKKNQTILSGKVNVINVKQRELTNSHLANIATNTTIILVFDTDTKDIDILRKNIQKLKKCRNVKEIWCVMQVLNLEDELIRATDVHEIKDLIGCRNNTDFKREWIREKRLIEKLKKHHFNYAVLWSTQPDVAYAGFENCGDKVKIEK